MAKMRIDWTTDGGRPVEDHGNVSIVRARRGKFVVVQWNPYHQNWVRENRHEGAAHTTKMDVAATDGLGGGPVYMSLTAAREAAQHSRY